MTYWLKLKFYVTGREITVTADTKLSRALTLIMLRHYVDVIEQGEAEEASLAVQ